jgi:alpha-amylase
VPTGLAGSQTGPGELTLSWTPSTDNVGVAGYIVYRNGTQIGTSPTASYVATGLPVGSNYIAVAAYDAAGNTTVKSPSINFPIA